MTREKYKFNFSPSDTYFQSRSDIQSITPARDKVERGQKDRCSEVWFCSLPLCGARPEHLKARFQTQGNGRMLPVPHCGWRRLCGPTAVGAPRSGRTGGEEHLQSERADGASGGPVRLPLARWAWLHEDGELVLSSCSPSHPILPVPRLTWKHDLRS